jgi:hypothetical protein
MRTLKAVIRHVRRVPGWPDVGVRAVVVAPAVALLAVASAPALAATQSQLPFRCFVQTGADHVVFGPDSFFLPSTVQGPTSFRENAGPTIVTYPLYRGTSRGRLVSYVITDASSIVDLASLHVVRVVSAKDPLPRGSGVRVRVDRSRCPHGATVEWVGLIGRPSEFTREWGDTSLCLARTHARVCDRRGNEAQRVSEQ